MWLEAIGLRVGKNAHHNRTTYEKKPDPKSQGYPPPAKIIKSGKKESQLHPENKPIGNQRSHKQRDKRNQGKKQIPPCRHCRQHVAPIHKGCGVDPRVGEQDEPQKGSSHQPGQQNHDGADKPPPALHRVGWGKGRQGALACFHSLSLPARPERSSDARSQPTRR